MKPQLAFPPARRHGLVVAIDIVAVIVLTALGFKSPGKALWLLLAALWAAVAIRSAIIEARSKAEDRKTLDGP